jgi:hypothetical protein
MFQHFKKLNPLLNLKKNLRSDFIKKFYEKDYHQWLNSERQLKRSVTMILEALPQKCLKHFTKHPLVVVKNRGDMACAFSSKTKINVLVIFPDLQKLMNSPLWVHAVAVLAHEIGHLYHNHSDRNISMMDAQYEADLFAAEIGFSSELMEVLGDYPYSEEVQLRLKRLAKFSQ